MFWTYMYMGLKHSKLTVAHQTQAQQVNCQKCAMRHPHFVWVSLICNAENTALGVGARPIAWTTSAWHSSRLRVIAFPVSADRLPKCRSLVPPPTHTSLFVGKHKKSHELRVFQCQRTGKAWMKTSIFGLIQGGHLKRRHQYSACAELWGTTEEENSGFSIPDSGNVGTNEMRDLCNLSVTPVLLLFLLYSRCQYRVL